MLRKCLIPESVTQEGLEIKFCIRKLSKWKGKTIGDKEGAILFNLKVINMVNIFKYMNVY